MYQAINDAMDTVMRKDPNSGNFHYKLIIYSYVIRYHYTCISALIVFIICHLIYSMSHKSYSLNYNELVEMRV